MSKQNWLIYKVEGEQYILTDDNERSIIEILSKYQPYTLVQVLDYLTGKIIVDFDEKLTIEALYGN